MAPSIPAGASLANVSVIDTGARVGNVKTTVFMEPSLSIFPVMRDLPAFSFLIEHPTQGSYLFDLGIRRDLGNLTPKMGQQLEHVGWNVTMPDDVSGVLRKGGVDLASVRGIVWSHWHWDHTGDPNTFPSSTDLIVGPGFKEAFVPNYPSVSDGVVDETAWSTRHMVEIDFTSSTTTIAGLRAHDFFGDGSFYLLDSPGHAVGHMMGLARTTNDSFILMGADACHHPGHFRPSGLAPTPDPLPCPGEVLARVHPHPERATTEPFYTYPSVPDGQGVHKCRADALTTRESLMQLDADPRVLVVIAHDATVLTGERFKTYPVSARDWDAQGWKSDVRWRFLADFAAKEQ